MDGSEAEKLENGCSEKEALLGKERAPVYQAKNGIVEKTKQTDIGVREDGISNFGTIMHVLKGNIGPGILSLPIAFSHAGILFGTVMLAVFGVVCVHCMHILVKCSHYLCRKFNCEHMDYADVTANAVKSITTPSSKVPHASRIVVNCFIVLTQFGFCCIYMIFIPTNIKLVVEKSIGNIPDSSDYRPNYPISLQIYELITLVLLIPLIFIKDMKHLAPFSLIANMASFIGLGVILYYVLIYEELKSVSRLPLIQSWSEIPLYFGTAIYSFESIGLILPIENRMREPKAFSSLFGVLNLGMTIICALYITVGFFGYIQFGENIQDSITLNLTSWYGIVVQILFSISVFVTYAVQFYVPLNIFGPAIATSRAAKAIGPNCFDYIVRTLLAIMTFAVAAIFGNFLNLLISLIGSIASSALALIFPPLLEILTFWPDRKERKYFWIMFSKDIVIMLFGVLCFLSGTVVSIQQLLQGLGSTSLQS